MPEICRFAGVILRMYHHDHLPSHLHAQYADHQATYAFSGACLRGALPPKKDKIVREWIAAHEEELGRCWIRAQAHGDIGTIGPLS